LAWSVVRLGKKSKEEGMEYKQIKYELSERVAIITLNRPEMLNAFTPRMGIELTDALVRVDEDDEVRAVIITGAGRGFCAGADLTQGAEIFRNFGQLPKEEMDWEKALREKIKQKAIVKKSDKGELGSWGGAIIHLLWSMKKPVIGALNGPAVGFGAAFPLWFDFRFASESAKIGFVFVRRGVTPESLSPWVLPRIVGLANALDLFLTGRLVKAKEALEIGLVSKVFADEELLARTKAFAKELYENSAPVALALTKRMVWQFLLENDPINVERVNHTYFFWSTMSKDCIEGIKSFLEKKKPEWKMSVSQDLPNFFPL